MANFSMIQDNSPIYPGVIIIIITSAVAPSKMWKFLLVILIDMHNYSPFIHCFMIWQKAFSFHESFALIYRMNNQRED